MSNAVATVNQGTLSPYLGTVSALIFNGNTVCVHGRLIRKHPNFAARFEHNQLHMKPGLRAIGNRDLDKIKLQFRMAVHVYDLAREYNIYQLEDLATGELVALTPMLQLGTMINILDQEEFTHNKIFGWLRDYISHEVMTAGKAATPSVVRGVSNDTKHNRPITGIVCEAMARMGMENRRLPRALKEK